MTTIWIDADSCPKLVREYILKYTKNLNINATFVANHPIPLNSDSSLHKMIVCEKGEGIADNYIFENSTQDDLVVTRDIPLAARLVEKKVKVLNDRGTIFTSENITQKLADRDFNMQLELIGLNGYKKNTYSKKEFSEFANCFDREIHKLLKI